MRYFVAVTFLLICLTANSQGENNIWFFGYEAGLDFNQTPPATLSNSVINAYEGTSVISDNKGKLLFFTDGQTVWNKNHEVMENGEELIGNHSSAQSSCIISHPSNPYLYYLVTIDGATGYDKGMCYSVIDMSLQAGVGEVIEKNHRLLNKSSEMLTAVRHVNNKYVWVITRAKEGGKFYSYLISDTGFNKIPIESEVGTRWGNRGIGWLKASHDGKYLVTAEIEKGVEMFDYNAANGKVSNARTIMQGIDIYYGVAFSPSDEFLYISTMYNYNFQQETSKVLQFDIRDKDVAAIKKSKYIVGQSVDVMFAALQLAPDNKIYIAGHHTSSTFDRHYLSTIDKPNNKGEACDFNFNSIFISTGKVLQGLPNFFDGNTNKYGIANSLTCFNQPVKFSYYGMDSVYADSVKWFFGDIVTDSLNYSAYHHSSHTYKSGGVYTVNLLLYFNNDSISIVKKIVVLDDNNLSLQDTVFCKDETIMYEVKGVDKGTVIWQDGGRMNPRRLIDTGSYILQAEIQGCILRDTFKAGYYSEPCNIFIPNAFTPNNDGLNDEFMPVSAGYTVESMRIYNSWGELIYNSNLSWDGTYKGANVPDGVYVYIVIYQEQTGRRKIRKGTVQVLR